MIKEYKKVPVYIAPDGQEFLNRNECKRHEFELRFEESSFNFGCNIELESIDDLAQFLQDEKEWIFEMMGWKLEE